VEIANIGEPGRGVYGISVAAELSGVGVQSLRLYETRGLLEPARSAGGTRRYSDDDVRRLRHISELLSGGLNLAGVAAVLELEALNQELRQQLAETPQGRARSHRQPKRPQ
jgi:MerR family transcriptional regulator, heat shock protein HspR